jgi:hypothetical protein
MRRLNNNASATTSSPTANPASTSPSPNQKTPNMGYMQDLSQVQFVLIINTPKASTALRSPPQYRSTPRSPPTLGTPINETYTLSSAADPLTAATAS